MKACLQWINSSVPEKINFYNYYNRMRNLHKCINVPSVCLHVFEYWYSHQMRKITFLLCCDVKHLHCLSFYLFFVLHIIISVSNPMSTDFVFYVSASVNHLTMDISGVSIVEWHSLVIAIMGEYIFRFLYRVLFVTETGYLAFKSKIIT